MANKVKLACFFAEGNVTFLPFHPCGGCIAPDTSFFVPRVPTEVVVSNRRVIVILRCGFVPVLTCSARFGLGHRSSVCDIGTLAGGRSQGNAGAQE